MIKVEMKFKKETTGTWVYGAAKGPITQLYIEKSAFKDGRPEEITIEVHEKP